MAHLHILGTHHCVNLRQESFKSYADLHGVFCRQYYSECVVASLSHQIQSEYYIGNIYVSIEGYYLDHFSASYQETALSISHSCKHHAVFQSFLSDNIKQDAYATAAHSKRIMELIKIRELLFMVLVPYGIIQMAVNSITDVLHHYTDCQLCFWPLIKLLTVGSVYQDMAEHF